MGGVCVLSFLVSFFRCDVGPGLERAPLSLSEVATVAQISSVLLERQLMRSVIVLPVFVRSSFVCLLLLLKLLNY